MNCAPLERDGKRSALSDYAFQFDASAMQGNRLLDYGQTQTGSRNRAYIAGSVKGLEQVPDFIRRNTNAMV